MSDEDETDRRIVVVVEVSSMLGRACASRFALDGAIVVAVDHSIEIAQDVAKSIQDVGGRCIPLHSDATDERQIATLAQTCSERWGRVDVLVITIGVIDWWEQEENSMEMWEESFRTNLLAPIFHVSKFQSLLEKSSSGSVVIYGSIDGIRGNPRVPAYSVARGGLIPFVHLMADKFAASGVRINYVAGAAISPSSSDTKEPSWPVADARSLLAATPLGRFAHPEDISGVVSFLASNDSNYVNGSVIVVDGGRTSITPGTSVHSDLDHP
ncbi:MAG: SDR family NAD(P)-dependent oxidoreductase [Acidimicrobiales bacterium]